MTFVGSAGLTATCSSACRRRVQSWFARGLVALPRFAHPIADAVASGGVSLPTLDWTSAASCRSSSNATSSPPEKCGSARLPIIPCWLLLSTVMSDEVPLATTVSATRAAIGPRHLPARRRPASSPTARASPRAAQVLAAAIQREFTSGRSRSGSANSRP